MYEWRRLSSEEREKLLKERKSKGHPWHGPPHEGGFQDTYHLTAACYEHSPIIGTSPQRMDECEVTLLGTVRPNTIEIYAWCVLPNHYHMLVSTKDVLPLLREIGQFHGRTSHDWNGQDGKRGRKVWHRCAERRIRTERHFWATLNYIHHNPVRHQYVKRWQDWPYSSACEFLDQVGRTQAELIWRQYPILNFGKGWDEAEK